MHGLCNIAESLGSDNILRLCGIHVIIFRWQASLLRAIKAIQVLVDYVPLAACLRMYTTGKQRSRQSILIAMLDVDTRKLYLSSPVAAFKGKHYYKEWEGNDGKKVMTRATIFDVKVLPLTH